MIDARTSKELDMPSYSGEQTYCLSLALDVREAIKALRLLAQTHQPSAQTRNQLERVMNSLHAVKAPDDLYAHLAPSAYDRHEQIQILEEVMSGYVENDVLEALRRITEGQQSERDIQAAISLLSAIEARALHHFDNPVYQEA